MFSKNGGERMTLLQFQLKTVKALPILLVSLSIENSFKSVTVEFAKTGAVPTQCLSCGPGFDAANCVIRFQEEDQTCANSEESLGTTHCGTAAIKFVGYGTNVTWTGIFRGCFDCSGKFCLIVLLM